MFRAAFLHPAKFVKRFPDAEIRGELAGNPSRAEPDAESRDEFIRDRRYPLPQIRAGGFVFRLLEFVVIQPGENPERIGVSAVMSASARHDNTERRDALSSTRRSVSTFQKRRTQ